MAFAQLGLHPNLVKAVGTAGYSLPTAVQTAAIPAAIAGGDLLVSSQTGSGKTAAFMLPCLQRLAAPVTTRHPRVLVLAPTRELAQQVMRTAETYGRFIGDLRCASLVGGAPFGPQLRALERRVDIIVATPGRLLDHLERGRVDLSCLEVLVLDEADRMLDMGFIADIETIIARTPAKRQTLLFSATLEGVVGKLAQRITRDARRIEINALPEERAQIDQQLMFADDADHKGRLLDALLRDADIGQALVFTTTKRAAADLSGRLRMRGFAADALHGDMNQRERNHTLQEMRRGRVRVLVATDVAARGIDVPGISHVINFDLPRRAEDYVHRIGRTGRAGRTGIAVSFAGHRERHVIREIERFTAQPIEVGVIPGLEPRPAPPRRAQGAPARRGGHRPNRSR